MYRRTLGLVELRVVPMGYMVGLAEGLGKPDCKFQEREQFNHWVRQKYAVTDSHDCDSALRTGRRPTWTLCTMSSSYGTSTPRRVTRRRSSKVDEGRLSSRCRSPARRPPTCASFQSIGQERVESSRPKAPSIRTARPPAGPGAHRVQAGS